MSEQVQDEREPRPVEPYATPRLHRFGTVTELTAGRQMMGQRDNSWSMNRTF